MAGSISVYNPGSWGESVQCYDASEQGYEFRKRWFSCSMTSKLLIFGVAVNPKKPLPRGGDILRKSTSAKHMVWKTTPTCVEWRETGKATERFCRFAGAAPKNAPLHQKYSPPDLPTLFWPSLPPALGSKKRQDSAGIAITGPN